MKSVVLFDVLIMMNASRNEKMFKIHHSTVQCSAVQYSTVQYSTVQYSTVQYSTVQYGTPKKYLIKCIIIK